MNLKKRPILILANVKFLLKIVGVENISNKEDQKYDRVFDLEPKMHQS